MGTAKVDVAKVQLGNSLKTYRPETSVGLRVYGHRISYTNDQVASCKDIELIAPVEPGYQGEIASWLLGYQALGMTPIASTLQQAVTDFTAGPLQMNSVVLISDGMETCGGDPCALVGQLEAQQVRFTLHVIGLNVDDPTRQQLNCAAQAGGGIYQDVRSSQELKTALDNVQQRVVQEGASRLVPTVAPTLALTHPSPGIGSTQISKIDGMKLMYVPVGIFQMGSESELDSEKPVHNVYLDAYWIDQTEVTNGKYSQCVAAGMCTGPYYNYSITRSSYYGNSNFANHPVINVDWSQAKGILYVGRAQTAYGG